MIKIGRQDIEMEFSFYLANQHNVDLSSFSNEKRKAIREWVKNEAFSIDHKWQEKGTHKYPWEIEEKECWEYMLSEFERDIQKHKPITITLSDGTKHTFYDVSEIVDESTGEILYDDDYEDGLDLIEATLD